MGVEMMGLAGRGGYVGSAADEKDGSRAVGRFWIGVWAGGPTGVILDDWGGGGGAVEMGRVWGTDGGDAGIPWSLFFFGGPGVSGLEVDGEGSDV